MAITDRLVSEFTRGAGLDPAQNAKIIKILENEFGPIRKDEVPARLPFDHRLYEGSGPFGAFDNEITSLVIDGGSALMNKIPMRKIKARTTRVSHLEWMAPTGFTGEITYPEWLRSIELGECSYGPAGVGWNGFTYEVMGGSFSFKTNSLKRYEDGGIKYYEEQPKHAFRGGPASLGGVIDNDADWAIARLLWSMQQHADYVLLYGDRANSEMEWDGIDQILRPGYVASHMVLGGAANWADPIWVNGAGVSDLWRIFQTIRVIIRTLRKRAGDRNWSIAPGDMFIHMGRTMWDNLREAIAAGAMLRFSNAYGVEARINFLDYSSEYRSTAPVGNMAILEVDGVPIPVLLDGNAEGSINLTVDDGEGGTTTVPAVTGDIMIMTLGANGDTYWYQEWLDWSEFTAPSGVNMWADEDRFMLQNGMVRAGVVTEASKCAYYFGEMMGRMVCTMLPMQGRLSNVVVPVLHEMELEQAAYWTRNFYGFGGGGAAGGEGTALLTPQP